MFYKESYNHIISTVHQICTADFIRGFTVRPYVINKWLRWSRGSVLAFGTQIRGFKPGRSRRIFQDEKKSSTRLPSEGK